MSADVPVILTPDMARRIRTMLLHSCGPQQETARALEAVASGEVVVVPVREPRLADVAFQIEDEAFLDLLSELRDGRCFSCGRRTSGTMCQCDNDE